MTDTPNARGTGGVATKITVADVTPELVREWFTDALRGSVGVGKEFSRSDVCARVGINENTLGSYLKGSNGPALWQFVRLAMVLGPDLINRLLGHVGMGGTDWLEPQGTSLWEVNAAVADFSGALAAALADDGRVDHREQAVLDPKVEAMVEVATRYRVQRANRRQGGGRP